MATSPTAPLVDAARLPALMSYVRDRRCVLFVGAGLSRAAGYPGWRGLMETVVRATRRHPGGGAAKVELAALLKARRYAELADQCREILGRSRFNAILRTELARPAAPPEATHRAIVATSYAAIVTTNYDTLLEDAYACWSDEGVPKAPTGAHLGRHGTLLLDGAFFILKAHGTIHDDASLVFTAEDYRRITHANPAFQAMMSAILLTYAVIFVGYSLGDPNFRLLLEGQLAVFGAQAPPRFAVMEGVGALESDILRRTAGITVLSYPAGEHEQVGAFLGSVAAACRTETSSHRAHTVVDRERSPLPALRFSLRPRGPMLDAEWFETTTDDLDGNRVPLERRYIGTAAPLPWMMLAAASRPYGRPDTGLAGQEGSPSVGALLGHSFESLQLPLVPAGQPRLVMLDVPDELAALPWEWMHVNGRPLCMQVPLCRTVPGFDDAARGRPFFHSPLRVLLIGDALAESPLHRHPLSGTRKEAETIGRRFRAAAPRHEVTLLTGKAATYERVLREMTDGYDIVHLAGVAYVDEAGESVVPLHDGNVRASELAALLIRNPPSLLFVNADYSGFVPAVGGDYAIELDTGTAFADLYHRMQALRPGLERVVARAGVGTFIGCLGACREDVAREIAVDFYTHLLAGRPIAQALFHARTARSVDAEDTALLFAMAGYPDACIAAPGRQ